VNWCESEPNKDLVQRNFMTWSLVGAKDIPQGPSTQVDEQKNKNIVPDSSNFGSNLAETFCFAVRREAFTFFAAVSDGAPSE